MVQPSRKVLLIGAQSGGKYLHGVEPDLKNFKAMVMSPAGGACREEEVKVLYNEPVSTVRRWMRQAEADYSLVYFTGHGMADSLGQRYLALPDGYLTIWICLTGTNHPECV